MPPARRCLPLLAVLLAACTVAVPSASANGDPASDYLISQSWFRPFESPVDESAAAELDRTLTAAKDAGFEIRVALIGTRADLGAVPVLYEKPQRYADFLGQELVFFYKGLLLVVMPNGYGLHRGKASLAAQKALLARRPAPGSTDATALVQAATGAVRALAGQRGITLPAGAATASSSKNRDRLTIAITAFVLAAGGLVVYRLVTRRSRGRADAA